jgi:hypothetical protein
MIFARAHFVSVHSELVIGTASDWLGVSIGVRNASIDNCIEVYALLEVVMSEQPFALKPRLLQCAVRSKVGGGGAPKILTRACARMLTAC